MAAADRGAALELKRCPKEQPSVEEPVLVHIAGRCDLHQMRCDARHAAATAIFDSDMRRSNPQQTTRSTWRETCGTHARCAPQQRTAMKQRKAYSESNHVPHNTSLAHGDATRTVRSAADDTIHACPPEIRQKSGAHTKSSNATCKVPAPCSVHTVGAQHAA